MAFTCDCGKTLADWQACLCETQESHEQMIKRAVALAHQEGGTHYKDKKIQPVEYCMANGIGFMEGSVIKYVTRWRDKGGVQDLKKAKHFLELLIEHEKARSDPGLFL